VDRHFFELVTAYRDMLKQPPLVVGKEVYDTFASTSHELWKVLVKPCLASLQGKHRMVIVPDATLSGVSFDALIDQLPDASASSTVDFSRPSYMIKQLAISYCYSAGWFLSVADGTEGEGRGMILFAPDYLGDADTLTGAADMATLEGAQQEVSDIAETFDATLFRGKEATRTRFQEVAPGARILHVAMHSMADEDQPLRSSLIFSSSDTAGRRLDAADLYSMRIPAELVVLSSCNSGGGKALPGEGMMSLSRAFIYSGSKSVVMTMWPVQDAAGASVMRLFYTHLEGGDATDIALQQAKLDFLKQSGSIQAHPSYWAAYALTGQRRVIRSEENYFLAYWKLSVAVLIILIAAGVLVVIRRRRALSDRKVVSS
jgi:CHAT domain-containing protein